MKKSLFSNDDAMRIVIGLKNIKLSIHYRMGFYVLCGNFFI